MRWFGKDKERRSDCPVHILDPAQPERVETWVIGKDVSVETYDQFKDEIGNLYAIVQYQDGKSSKLVVTKPIWDFAKQSVFDQPAPSSFEEHFNYYYNALLSSDSNAQAVAAATINAVWRGFNAAFPDFDSFRNADEKEKGDYLLKLGDMIKKMASDELNNRAPEGTSRGAALVHLYLTAVATNNASMVNRIADALEPLNRLAQDMLANSPHER
jgi:hypothetical protein